MSYAKFFDGVESIKLFDPLAQFLGAFDDGNYEVTFLEVVKAAGHSCPTVAGAYLAALEGLKVLYPEGRAVRGALMVEFSEDAKEGVAGVIANVISHITGATESSGFKGLNGKFARHSLMSFNASIDSSVRFTRVDNKKSVDVYYDHSTIGGNPKMQQLMQKAMMGMASADEIKEFGALWQSRVEDIIRNKDRVIRVVER